MAVKSVKDHTSLDIRLIVGKNDNGKNKVKKLSLKNIKPAASDQDIFDLAGEVSKILLYPVDGFTKQDTSTLINE